VPRITARRRGSGWGSATGPECRRPRSAKRIDSPSMMHGSSARSGRLCPAITARGRGDSMVSRVVIVSRRRPVPDPGGGPQPRPLRPCRRPGRSRRDVGGLGRCRWWCTRDLDPPAPGNARPQARPATDTEQACPGRRWLRGHQAPRALTARRRLRGHGSSILSIRTLRNGCSANARSHLLAGSCNALFGVMRGLQLADHRSFITVCHGRYAGHRGAPGPTALCPGRRHGQAPCRARRAA
jgi:hypothetical protein